MTTAPRPALPGVFSLLRQTFALIRAHTSLIYGYAAWLLLPLVVTLFANLALQAEAAMVVQLLFGGFLYFFLFLWVNVVLILATPHLARRERFNQSSLSFEATSLMVPYFLVNFVVFVVNFFGFLALLFPGFLFSTWFAFSGIIAVLKKESLLAAMKNSRELSKGRFAAVFIRLVGGGVVLGAIYFLALFSVEVFPALLTQTSIETAFFATPNLVEDVAYRLIEILLWPFFLIYQTLLFLHLSSSSLAKPNLS